MSVLTWSVRGVVGRGLWLYTLVTLVLGTTDPSNLACTAINSTAIRVTWTQATDVSVLGYHLDCDRVDGLVIEPDIPTAVLADKTYDTHDVGGLGKYAVYGVNIHSYTSGGNLTDYYINCTTNEDVPSYTSGRLDCVGITISAIRCTWLDMEQVYWNGIPTGWRLQYISTNMSEMNEVTTTSGTLTASAYGLTYDTSYIFMLVATTSVGPGTMYISTIASTLGSTTTTEEPKQKHYCYEAFPGYLEFGWDEMPCTIYTGTIAGLIVIVFIFISIFACQACCSKSGGGKMMLNIENQFESNDGGGGGRRRKRRPIDDDDDDDDDDDYYNDDVPPKGGRNDDDDYPTESDELTDDNDDDDNRGVKNPITPVNAADYRDPATPQPDTKKPVAKARDDSAAMGRRQQSGVNLDGALSSRQIELDEAEGGWSDSDYDSQYDSYDEEEEELSDTVPPLPVALTAGGKKGHAKSTSRLTTTAAGTRPKTSKPGTKNTTKITTKATTKSASNETKGKATNITDSKNKSTKPVSGKTRKLKINSRPSFSKCDGKTTPNIVVTKASVHFETTDEIKSDENEDQLDEAGESQVTDKTLDKKHLNANTRHIDNKEIEHNISASMDTRPQMYDQSSSGYSEELGEWDDEQPASVTKTMPNKKGVVTFASPSPTDRPTKQVQAKQTPVKKQNIDNRSINKKAQDSKVHKLQSQSSEWEDEDNITSEWDEPVQSSRSPVSEWDEPGQTNNSISEWNDEEPTDAAFGNPHTAHIGNTGSYQAKPTPAKPKTNNRSTSITHQTKPGTQTNETNLSNSENHMNPANEKMKNKLAPESVTNTNGSETQKPYVKTDAPKSEWDYDDEDEVFLCDTPVTDKNNQFVVGKPSNLFMIQPTTHTTGTQGSSPAIPVNERGSSPAIPVNKRGSSSVVHAGKRRSSPPILFGESGDNSSTVDQQQPKILTKNQRARPHPILHLRDLILTRMLMVQAHDMVRSPQRTQ